MLAQYLYVFQYFLKYLGKYSEFHKLYADGDFQAAGNLLLLLLKKRLVPKQ